MLGHFLLEDIDVFGSVPSTEEIAHHCKENLAVLIADQTTSSAKIVTTDNAELYEKLVKDLGETGTKFQSWWDMMSAKYQWESVDGGNWEINFDTCEIFLVTGGK